MYTASRRPDPGMSRGTQVNLPHMVASSRQDSRRILMVTWLGSLVIVVSKLLTVDK